jgi:hypothetical protein
MECPSAPVIDVERQVRIEKITSQAPVFNVFNIVALVVIALAAFFLYKRYKDKQAVESAHMVAPSPIIVSEPEVQAE